MNQPQTPEQILQALFAQLIKDAQQSEVIFIGPELPEPKDLLEIQKYGFGPN